MSVGWEAPITKIYQVSWAKKRESVFITMGLPPNHADLGIHIPALGYGNLMMMAIWGRNCQMHPKLPNPKNFSHLK
jgi:hypothetical protein